MIEMSVVFPHPDGPTTRLSSPARKVRSTPRRATVLVSPVPNSFVTPRHDTAACVPRRSASLPLGSSKVAIMASPPCLAAENDGRFQHEYAPRAEDTRHDYDDEDRRARPRERRPGHVQSGQVGQ